MNWDASTILPNLVFKVRILIHDCNYLYCFLIWLCLVNFSNLSFAVGFDIVIHIYNSNVFSWNESLTFSFDQYFNFIMYHDS